MGTQSISPFYWAIESGSLECARAMIQDLLTIRADRRRAENRAAIRSSLGVCTDLRACRSQETATTTALIIYSHDTPKWFNASAALSRLDVAMA